MLLSVFYPKNGSKKMVRNTVNQTILGVVKVSVSKCILSQKRFQKMVWNAVNQIILGVVKVSVSNCILSQKRFQKMVRNAINQTILGVVKVSVSKSPKTVTIWVIRMALSHVFLLNYTFLMIWDRDSEAWISSFSWFLNFFLIFSWIYIFFHKISHVDLEIFYFRKNFEKIKFLVLGW